MNFNHQKQISNKYIQINFEQKNIIVFYLQNLPFPYRYGGIALAEVNGRKIVAV